LERRVADRRTSGSAVDVSRLEHENLFRQVDEVLRRVSRLELEMNTHQARIEALEKFARDVLRPQRP
jgi:phage shock protein A